MRTRAAAAELARLESAWARRAGRADSAHRRCSRPRVAEYDAQRSEEAAEIAPDMLRTYDHIRIAHQGRALAKLDRNLCTGCRISLPDEHREQGESRECARAVSELRAHPACVTYEGHRLLPRIRATAARRSRSRTRRSSSSASARATRSPARSSTPPAATATRRASANSSRFCASADKGFVVVVVPSIEALGGDLRDAARRYFQLEGLGAQIAPMTGTPIRRRSRRRVGRAGRRQPAERPRARRDAAKSREGRSARPAAVRLQGRQPPPARA